MSYENPQLPEGVNYSHDNPLKELAILLAGATALVVAAVFALSLSAGWLATKIPFATEQAWAQGFAAQLPAQAASPAEQAAVVRLQAMVDRIAVLQQLPAEMKPVVHIVDGDELNAFATLGGHVLITRGMLAKLPHENALVAVLAHEVGHVQHRDPVVALGRGVAVMAALGAISGLGDGGMVAGHLQGAGVLTSMSFNRDQERTADDEALHTLAGWYGYTAGGADLFELLAAEHGGREPPAFLNTHPATAERIARMRTAETPGRLVPLPAEITDFVKSGASIPVLGRE